MPAPAFICLSQRNYRLLTRATERVLTSAKAFWRLLLRDRVHFTELTASFLRIEEAQENAIRTYRMVLDRCVPRTCVHTVCVGVVE